MSSFLLTLSTLLNKVSSLILAPFVPHYSWLGLFLASVVAGVVLLLLYGKISNQQKIATVKGGIYRDLLEAVIFRHQIGTSIKAQGRMLWGAIKYFTLAIPPLLILAIPCILFLSQLNLYFGKAPIQKGKASLVSIELEKGVRPEKFKIISSEGLSVTGPVRDGKLGEAFIKVQPINEGQNNLVIEAGGSKVAVPVLSKESRMSVSSVLSLSWVDQLLYASPLSATLKDSKINRINIQYDDRYYTLAGVSMHWVVFFFVVSFLSGLLTCKIFKIEI